MNGFRRLAATYRLCAVLILAAALAIRVLVPTGFMPVLEQGSVVMRLCSGVGPQTNQANPSMSDQDMAAMSHSAMSALAPAVPGEHGGGKADSPCAFAGLAVPALSGADPFLLAALLLFILLLAVRPPAAQRSGSIYRLRPPLRGPPATT